MRTRWTDEERTAAERLLRLGFEEDLGTAGDITSAAVIPSDRRSQAFLVARQDGIVAGLEALTLLPSIFGEGWEATLLAPDGPVREGDRLARCSGPTRTVLAVERTMLNFVCRLSGIASLTARFVDAVRGTRAVVCDTRKTTPGWRLLDKFAVRIGGGTNHRFGLYDAILIKDNHLADLAREHAHPLRVAVERAREHVARGTVIEIEVDTIRQLEEALAVQPDIILLDNMTNDLLSMAVELRNTLSPTVLLEGSGGVNLQTIRSIAETGVDRISVGAITHSAPILDLALDDTEE